MWTELLAILVVVSMFALAWWNIPGENLPGSQASCLYFNFLGIYYLWSNSRAVPMLANILLSTLGACKIFEREGIYKCWIGHRLVIAIYKPEYMQEVMDGTKFSEKTDFFAYMKEFLKEGLITSTGPKWKSRRRMITPVFHFRVFEGYQEIVNLHTDRLVKHLGDFESDWVDVRTILSKCLLDVIGAAAFGIELNALEGDNEYLEHLKKVLLGAMSRIVNPLLSPTLIFSLTSKGKAYYKSVKFLNSFTMKLIKQRKAEILENLGEKKDQNGEKKPKSFLNLLVEEHVKNNSLSLSDIEEEVQTFLFAGHDTTATANSWTLYHLGRHPEILRQVQQEVDSVLDEDRPITAEDLKQLQYLEMVIKESNRITPPVPIIGRITREESKIGVHTIPKGTNIVLGIYHLHHNAQVFPNPEKFDPERFRPGSPQLLNRHPFAFIPFSAGPRNCIGQKLAMIEQKTLIAAVVKHFNVESRDPFDTLMPSLNITLTSVQPLILKFTPRCHQ